MGVWEQLLTGEAGLVLRDRTAVRGVDGAALREAAVGLLIAGDPVTVMSVDEAAGLPGGSLHRFYPSVDAVFVDVVAELTRVYRGVLAAELRRRRSTKDLFAAGLSTLWAAALSHLDEHRAVQIIRLTRPDLEVPGAAAGGGGLVSELPLSCAQWWLEEVRRVQDIVWHQPVPVLAKLVVTTLDGLVLGAAHARDTAWVDEVLRLFAYQLAQHSNRRRPPVAAGGRQRPEAAEVPDPRMAPS